MKAAAGFVALLLSTGTAFAQLDESGPGGRELRELSLEHAVEEALRGNPDLAIAEAQAEAARSGGRVASAGLWPQLVLEGGYTRSTDPVFAFGTKLRQGQFGEEDFAIDALNDPEAIGDWSAGLALRWSLLDAAVWSGRAAARKQAEAAAWSSERQREATVLMTRTHYHRAQAAAALLEAAQASVEAAGATLESFRQRRERGLLTEADLLQAEAELAAAQAELSDAQRIRLDALQDLGRQLGWSPDTLPLPSDSLAAPEPVEEGEFDPHARADLRALASAASAADASRTGAVLAFVPALHAFAGYATHSEELGFDENDWTVGVMLRWTVFSGFGRTAELQRATHERRVARIRYERTLRDARSEVDQAQRAVRSASRQVEATRTAAAAAESGRDLMRRRFEEGLVTAADLLQAEARATNMRVRAIRALAQYHMAVARLEFVWSQSNPESER